MDHPTLQRSTCTKIDAHGNQTCQYVYHHFPSHSRATIRVRKKHGILSVMNGFSSTPTRSGCATVTISNNYGDESKKISSAYRDYEMHELHRKEGCPPSDFGVLLWGMADVWHKMKLKGTIGAHVTEGGAIFGQRTQSTFSLTDPHTIIAYNLDGIQSYAQNRFAIQRDTFKERSDRYL